MTRERLVSARILSQSREGAKDWRDGDGGRFVGSGTLSQSREGAKDWRDGDGGRFVGAGILSQSREGAKDWRDGDGGRFVGSGILSQSREGAKDWRDGVCLRSVGSRASRVDDRLAPATPRSLCASAALRENFVALAALLLLLSSGCGENQTFPGPTPYSPGAEPAFECLPDLNGSLESGELPVAIGEQVGYLVGTDRPVDIAGAVDEAGRQSWDNAVDYADDRIVRVGPERLVDQWFADEFVGADFVAPVDVDGTILGVYHQDARALWLHGVASREPDPAEGRTLLPYDAPVALFVFPLEPGRRWTSVGEISEGTAFGLAYRGTDTYQVEVRGAGRLDLPDWSFGQAWRVDQQVTVAPAAGAPPVQRRITSWLFECFGEVARAQSADGVTEPFSQAAELRRITSR